jgi:MYXO-CTERM domain-containing protein
MLGSRCNSYDDDLNYGTLVNDYSMTIAGNGINRLGDDLGYRNSSSLRRSMDENTGIEEWVVGESTHRTIYYPYLLSGSNGNIREISQSLSIAAVGQDIYPANDKDVTRLDSVPLSVSQAQTSFKYTQYLSNGWDCHYWVGCSSSDFKSGLVEISGFISSFYVIPEPTCAALALVGLGAVGALSRRRQQR